MSFDYSSLLGEENEYITSWKDIYDENKSLPDNFLNILKQSVYLPLDHYKIIAAYSFIPSALARVVPYLFLWGISGSGKSTIGKLVSRLHGVKITSSTNTFAAIRNSLNKRRKAIVNVPSNNPSFPTGYQKEVETNTIMVWDDIDPSVFNKTSDFYRLFKFGYDKSSDVIEISSSEEVGTNLKFHCFCPKIFSSISPLHLDNNLKELRRRLLVIPTKTIENLSEARKQELEIYDCLWEEKLLNVDNLSWQDFNLKFKQFWDLDMAKLYLENRNLLVKSLKGLTSQERVVSIDLLTTGITTGIWNDEIEAITDVKNYWEWFKGEVNIGESPLVQLLKKIVKQEELNARNGGIEPIIHNQQIKGYCEGWFNKSYLLEKTSSKNLKNAMHELGYRLIVGGKWIKS